ncbi:MAG: electron transport complex subunit E [Prevotellaceae bacterium]|jgi:electron transport complex protein RnfE|nr:electron transport complex subunit E [Prevotellaceae bacterium]
MSNWKTFINGLWKENPTVVLVLGTCPTLAVTTEAINGLGMGAATTFVLVFANIFVSLLKNFIPDKVRIAAFVVIIASFVTVVDLVMKAYTPALYSALGIFIPLIVVNCILLGRAESFAQKNGVFPSLLDGLGMGLGFTAALTIMASVRELLGNGSIFGHSFGFENNMLLFILPPGAFLVYGYMIALTNKIKSKQK